MSALASAVLESLQRLLPPKQSSALLPAVVQALIQALEEGEGRGRGYPKVCQRNAVRPPRHGNCALNCTLPTVVARRSAL